MMPQCGAAGSSWPYNNHGKTYPSRVSTFTGIYSQANGLSTKITTMTKVTFAEGSLDEQYNTSSSSALFLQEDQMGLDIWH